MELKIDYEFENKIPPLSSEELMRLEDSILSEGRLINPIVVWNGIIVDGHNRYRIICENPEIEYDIYEKDFADRNEAIAWICQNQLGRRNLTPEQKKYLIGKQFEAEKAMRGGNHGNQYTASAKCQVGTLPPTTDTAERIANENGIGRRSVFRAEAFSKAVDIADEVEPGIRAELLAGEIKATEKDIRELVTADPIDRPALIENLRQPLPKKPHKRNDPETELIQKIADDMLEAKSHGKPTTMIYEMNDALESMIFRWEFCESNHADFFELEDCLSEIEKLIRNGYEFLQAFEARHRK